MTPYDPADWQKCTMCGRTRLLVDEAARVAGELRAELRGLVAVGGRRICAQCTRNAVAAWAKIAPVRT